MDVFDVFEKTPYTFLQVSRGTVTGDVVDSQTEASGVFKLRTGMVSVGNEESRQTDATLHIRPSEAFVATNDNNLVGHGVIVDGAMYEIVGQTSGRNYDNGVLEHYRLTLAANDFVGVEDDS